MFIIVRIPVSVPCVRLKDVHILIWIINLFLTWTSSNRELKKIDFLSYSAPSHSRLLYFGLTLKHACIVLFYTETYISLRRQGFLALAFVERLYAQFIILKNNIIQAS